MRLLSHRWGRVALKVGTVVSVIVWVWVASASAGDMAHDPGVRGGPPGAGGPLGGLSANELAFFLAGQANIQEVDSVQGTIPNTGLGLGPLYNLDSCAGCHAQPAPGGTSPFVNPQVAAATKAGATNTVPFFVTLNGPVRDALLRLHPDGTPDGSLQNLYTISGRVDAPGCVLSQPDFGAEAGADNLAFHIPSPIFGAGLVESIDDATILGNQAANAAAKQALGIGGRPAFIGSTIGRFGWKAQGQSILLFVGGAYNAEQGVTNFVSPTERDQTPGCLFNATPEDRINPNASTLVGKSPDIVRFAAFAQFSAPPMPIPDTASIARGRTLFRVIGCALCHTPSLPTGTTSSAALSGQSADLYSDLLLHQMGPGLADGILAGDARPDEFRTAPLWGAGQRIFFLHDGRTADLLEAIRAHASRGDGVIPASEANLVIAGFNALTEGQKQDILNFLRAL